MEIIPAIDIIGGKCVRLTQGDYAQKKEYHSQPLEVAREFEKIGIKRLHVVDLDGAKAKTVVNLDVLSSITEGTSLSVDFGGGVRTDEDLYKVFKAGAKQVTCGSVAVKNPELAENWLEVFGAEKLILGADVKNRKIAVSGWEENSDIDLFAFLERYLAMGFRYVICTDISKDGLLKGPSFDLYADILQQFPQIKLIASGGVTTISDVEKLKNMGIYGAIIGKAIYEGLIKPSDLIPFLN